MGYTQLANTRDELEKLAESLRRRIKEAEERMSALRLELISVEEKLRETK